MGCAVEGCPTPMVILIRISYKHFLVGITSDVFLFSFTAEDKPSEVTPSSALSPIVAHCLYMPIYAYIYCIYNFIFQLFINSHLQLKIMTTMSHYDLNIMLDKKKSGQSSHSYSIYSSSDRKNYICPCIFQVVKVEGRGALNPSLLTPNCCCGNKEIDKKNTE